MLAEVPTQNLRSTHIAGSLYGHLCGDAFGVPYEFESPHSLPSKLTWGASGTYGRPAGTWSDDGAMMLCHVASILETGRLDPDDTGRRFVRWLDEGYMAADNIVFDVGNTTEMALERIRQGVPAINAGPAHERDNGNGSLMRILPVALWTASMPVAAQLAACHDASRITHAHPRSQACCALYGQLIRLLLERYDPADAWPAAWSAVERAYAENTAFAPQREELNIIRRFNQPNGSGYVVDTLISAWDAFSKSTSYTEAIERAVRFGNDTDTTAAVAGSLAGLHYGLEAIPAAWRADLKMTAELREMIAAFTKAASPGASA